jgi:hypothetical protein
MQDLKKTIQDQDKGKPKNEQLWNSKMQEAVKHAAYGKPSAEELKLVTEALIKSGKLQETKSHYTSALTDSEAIRMMQWENGIGIDCSGFVSQAFVKAHGGTHDKYKLQNPMNENLMDLKHNSKFTPVKPVDVRPGDLITLDKPAPNDVGHTVLVREHHMADYDVLKNLPNGTSFAGANDKIHSYKVDASWGASSNGWLGGGVQTKVWLYNETTGKWAMLNQKNPGGLTVEESSMSGPYNHPMNGIYRPKP